MPWMPPTLFTEDASREFKDRMPYVTDGPGRAACGWTKKGANFGLKNGVGPSGREAGAGAEQARRHHGRNGPVRRRQERHPPRQRPASARQGHGPRRRRRRGDLRRARHRFEDERSAEAANEVLQIYNDWLADFCSHYPDRHIGLAASPMATSTPPSPKRTVAAKMGLKGVEVSCSWDMEPMWHPLWEPLWQAVQKFNLPLHFHTFPTTAPEARAQTSGQVRRAAMFTGVSVFQMGLIHILAAMIGAGVFERYPNLRVSFGESGIGWIPYALDRMDFEFEDRFRDLMKLKPSEMPGSASARRRSSMT